MAVVATKDGHGSLLDTSEEAKGATRDSGGVTSLELMSGGVATRGGDHADAVLTQELDLNTGLGSKGTEDGALTKDGGADERGEDGLDELHFVR